MLDIYVGTLTRYYSRQWETIGQVYAREHGLAYEQIRPDRADEEAVTDPERIRELALIWRHQLKVTAQDSISDPLEWTEHSSAPYFTHGPSWDTYSDLLLWASYAEHPELERPLTSEHLWHEDQAWAKSVEEGYSSAYSHLLEPEMWLPCRFDAPFFADSLAGVRCPIGSSYRLLEQLESLNKNTWGAQSADIARWRDEGFDESLESRARFCFGIFHDLALRSIQHRLPMILDY